MLRPFRVRTGRNLTDVAKQVGSTPATLSRVETGKRVPSLPLAAAVMVELGLTDAEIAEVVRGVAREQRPAA